MAAGDTLEGRRLPDDLDFDTLYEALTTERGAYAVGPTGPDGDALWASLPDGQVIRIPVQEGPPPGGRVWGMTVHDDGRITLAPSIRTVTVNTEYHWHGFLEHGVWREVE